VNELSRRSAPAKENSNEVQADRRMNENLRQELRKREEHIKLVLELISNLN
jgi:hypothetical protein